MATLSFFATLAATVIPLDKHTLTLLAAVLHMRCYVHGTRSGRLLRTYVLIRGCTRGPRNAYSRLPIDESEYRSPSQFPSDCHRKRLVAGASSTAVVVVFSSLSDDILVRIYPSSSLSRPFTSALSSPSGCRETCACSRGGGGQAAA